MKRDLNELYFKGFFQIYDFPEGLNPTHMLTLIHLDHAGPSPMTQISHLMQLEKGSFTPVAGKLVEMGFIRKDKNREDKRISELHLTESGLKLVTDFKEEHKGFILERISLLPEKEQREYFSLMNRLNELDSIIIGELSRPDN
nr:MarR family transcriptional regulator [Spirochaeta isovalerica]